MRTTLFTLILSCAEGGDSSPPQAILGASGDVWVQVRCTDSLFWGLHRVHFCFRTVTTTLRYRLRSDFEAVQGTLVKAKQMLGEILSAVEFTDALALEYSLRYLKARHLLRVASPRWSH